MAESTADLLERYKQEVESSLKWREERFDPIWREAIDFYRQRPPGYDEHDCEHKIQVNLIHSTVNIIVANTLLRYPKITVTPRRINQANYSRSVLGAALSESSINYYWRRYRYQEQFRLAFKDSVICGHGWVKCMWDFSEPKERMTQEQFSEVFQDPDSDAKRATAVAIQKAPMGASELTPTATQREQERHGTDIIRDMPRVERISIFHMLVDPEATTMENARWVAQIVRVPNREAKENKKWDKQARENLPTDDTTDSRHWNPDRRETSMEMGPTDWVTYYEFYDMENGTWCQFSEGAERFLVKPAVMPYKFGLPFEFMGNHQVPDQFYPMGDVETLTDLQAELNIVRTQIIEDRKKYRRQWMYKPENVTDELVQMLESDSDDKMAPIQDDADFDDVMSPVPQLPIDPQLYDVSAMVSRDIDVISGTTDYQRGGAPAGRTATEAAILNDASQSRAAEKLFGVEQAMARISEKVVMLMQQYMTEKDVAILGNIDAIIPNSPTAQQVGNEVFYKFDRENIAGLYDFTVEAGSTQPVNEAVRRQEALQLANVMVPFVQTGLVDGQRVAEELLRRGFGIDDPSTFLTNPSLLQQQAAAGAGPAAPATPVGGAPPVGAIPVAGQDGQNPAPDPTGGAIGSINQLAGQIGLDLG